MSKDKEKEIEIEYIGTGRYVARDKVGQSDFDFNPTKPKQKVPERLAKHLLSQKEKYTNKPYFKVKGTKPDITGSPEPDIQEGDRK